MTSHPHTLNPQPCLERESKGEFMINQTKWTKLKTEGKDTHWMDIDISSSTGSPTPWSNDGAWTDPW